MPVQSKALLCSLLSNTQFLSNQTWSSSPTMRSLEALSSINQSTMCCFSDLNLDSLQDPWVLLSNLSRGHSTTYEFKPLACDGRGKLIFTLILQSLYTCSTI